MRALRTFLPAAGLLLVAAPAALAGTLRVPSEAYPTLQSAVDAAVPGDEILVAPGGYAEDLVIAGKVGITLRARGGASVSGANFSTQPCIRVTGGSGIVLLGLGVTTGLTNAPVCLSAEGVAGLEVRNAWFRGSTGTAGITMSGCTGATISRCRFSSIDGVGIQDEDSTSLAVEGCRFYWPNDDVLRLSPGAAPGEGSDLAVVRRNRADGSVDPDAGGAVRVTGQGVTVDGNCLDLVAPVGIQVTGTSLVVTRNTISRCQGRALDVSGDGLVRGNSVLRGQEHGIVLGGGAATVQQNRVSACDGVGVLVLSPGAILTGNRGEANDLFDLADASAEGVNAYSRNRFGTTVYSYDP